MIIRQQGSKPNIKLQSPQSDVSSENEDVYDDTITEKKGIKMPIN